MSLKERLSPDAYVDHEGDVLPFADIKDDMDIVPTSNASIVQGIENLKGVQAAAAREALLQELAEQDAKHGRETAVINDGLANPGVYVGPEQHYQDELDLMNLVSGANKRGGKVRGKKGGFEVAHRTHPEILDMYGPQLPNVAEGAHRNHLRMENSDPLSVYHAKELIDAGIGHKAEIIFDAQTQMKSAYRDRYYGTDEKDRLRKARRKYLNKMLAHYANQ